MIDTVNTYASFRAPLGRYPSIAMNYSGVPVVAYWDSIHGQVRCASKPGSSWLIDIVGTVASEPDVVPSLAIDGNNDPAVAYVGMSGTNAVLKLAVKSGGSWTATTVDSGRVWYAWPSLAYDCQGEAHIAFAGVADDGGAVMWYASHSGAGWSKEVADSIPNERGIAMKGVRLALDGHGRPRIAYTGSVAFGGGIEFPPPRDETTVIKYPIKPPQRQVLVRLRYVAKNSSWLGEFYDPYPEYEFGDLALDRNGLPSIAYVADGGLAIASRYGWSASADAVPPATISSLAGVSCDPDISEWTVHWTVPYDDSSCFCSGPIASYDMRTNASSITSGNWSSSDEVSIPSPADPFETVQTATIDVLTAVYCRVKAIDGKGNESGLSNQIHLFPCYGDGMYAGGGDGGDGFSLKRLGGETHLTNGGGGGSGGASAGENSLLSGLGVGSLVRDMLRLPSSLDDGSGFRVYVRAAAGRRLDMSAAKLLVVDHSSDTEALPAGSGALVGRRILASSARDSMDRDVTDEVNGSGAGFVGYPGTTVVVATSLDSVTCPLVVDAAELETAPFPILVETQANSGGWRTVGSVIPRAHSAACVVDSVPPGPIRLEFTGATEINSVGRLAVATSGFSTGWAQLSSATTADGTDERIPVADTDSSSFTMFGPDTLNLQFSVTPPSTGFVRDGFLTVEATPLLAGQAGSTSLRRAEVSLPVQFALHQNQPNPFRAGTMIRFDLPQGQLVRLDIFDAQGRRVRQLLNRFIPAGYQNVGWDHRDGAGMAVHPGVFFYRIQTSSFRDRKKMVLLP